MEQTMENKLLSRILGCGRGLVFSQKNFSLIGTCSSFDKPEFFQKVYIV